MFLLFFNSLDDDCRYVKSVYSQEVIPQDSNLYVNRDSLKVFYIGNMGVLIKHQNQVILIDGFHKKYKPAYIFPSKTNVQKLMNGNYYQNSSIDIVLVTHYHKDHFDAELVKEYLLQNEKSIIAGTSQVTDKVKVTLRKRKILNRIKEIPYNDKKVFTIRHNDIEVKAFKSPHINLTRHRTVQNIAYIVKTGDYSILHVGDSSWNKLESSLKTQNLIDEHFDAILLPYWMLLNRNQKKKIQELIKAKKIIVTHIPPSLSDREKKVILSDYNNIILFDVQGKEITL